MTGAITVNETACLSMLNDKCQIPKFIGYRLRHLTFGIRDSALTGFHKL
jgi:hypothetical protein